MTSGFQNNAIFWVDVDRIKPNPYQPRKDFNQESLESLAESIKQYGVLQPLVVTRKEEELPDGGIRVYYELVAGERRLRAAKLAGLTQVPVLIRDKEDSDKEKLELAIIENLQREDLNPIDRALAFKQLHDKFGMTHAQIAKKMGKSREYVSNTLRMLSLPEEIQRAIASGVISEGHARPLLMLSDKPEEQKTLFKEIVMKKLTVREAEHIAKGVAADKVRKNHIPPEIRKIEMELMENLGTRVRIEQKGENAGRIHIDFTNKDDLEHFLNLVKRHHKEHEIVPASNVSEESSNLNKELNQEKQEEQNEQSKAESQTDSAMSKLSSALGGFFAGSSLGENKPNEEDRIDDLDTLNIEEGLDKKQDSRQDDTDLEQVDKADSLQNESFSTPEENNLSFSDAKQDPGPSFTQTFEDKPELGENSYTKTAPKQEVLEQTDIQESALNLQEQQNTEYQKGTQNLDAVAENNTSTQEEFDKQQDTFATGTFSPQEPNNESSLETSPNLNNAAKNQPNTFESNNLSSDFSYLTAENKHSNPEPQSNVVNENTAYLQNQDLQEQRFDSSENLEGQSVINQIEATSNFKDAEFTNTQRQDFTDKNLNINNQSWQTSINTDTSNLPSDLSKEDDTNVTFESNPYLSGELDNQINSQTFTDTLNSAQEPKESNDFASSSASAELAASSPEFGQATQDITTEKTNEEIFPGEEKIDLDIDSQLSTSAASSNTLSSTDPDLQNISATLQKEVSGALSEYPELQQEVKSPELEKSKAMSEDDDIKAFEKKIAELEKTLGDDDNLYSVSPNDNQA